MTSANRDEKNDSVLVSVIIPTYLREQHLCATIADVLAQEYEPFELIVVDQSPNHSLETGEYLRSLQQTQQVKWYQVDWANVAAARNYGVRRAKGMIAVFIDDDVQLPKKFLKAHVDAHLSSSNIGCVAGRVLTPNSQLRNQSEIDYFGPEAMDPAVGWYNLNFESGTRPQNVLSARGCNMSIPRELFSEQRMFFDERFGDGKALREESDLCLRIAKTGLVIRYFPAAVLTHLEAKSGGCHQLHTRTFRYQIAHYRNDFLLALKNLTPSQMLRFARHIFNCQVRGLPPCNKSGAAHLVLGRLIFYVLGFASACLVLFQGIWDDGQKLTRLDTGGEDGHSC